MPSSSDGQLSSGPSTNDDTTTHKVIRAPSDTSNACTINALVCAIAASASGIVAIITPLRLNVDRNVPVLAVGVGAEQQDQQAHRRDRQPPAALEVGALVRVIRHGGLRVPNRVR